MTVHRDLDGDRVAELRAALAEDDADADAPAPARRRGLRQFGDAAVRRVAGRYLTPLFRSRIDAVVAPLSSRVAEIEELADDMRGVSVNFELLKAETAAGNAAAVNLELLKAEFRTLLSAVEELGMAIAPAAGLEGAAARTAELRERVNALERRVRDMGRATTAAAPRTNATTDAVAPAQAEPQSTLFDYVGFERRFRGDPDAVLAELSNRYMPVLRDHSPVLDIGCGRGELLSVLAESGARTIGVDTDPAMVAEARARGLEVHEQDAVAFLREQPEHSLGAIIALHVAEHLQLDALIQMLELAATRLRPGGIFVGETPNPATLIVLGNSYILDPTHVRPLHPSLFTFLCEGAGFTSVRLEFYSPAEAYQLQPIDAPGAPEWVAQVNSAFDRLNTVLFGPQDYAVIATTPPERSTSG